MSPYIFGAPGFDSKLSMSSFRRKPSPSAVTYDPKLPLRVVVTATALPSASRIEKWVVSLDSPRDAERAFGGGGRNPAGCSRLLEELGALRLMVSRQAAAYFLSTMAAIGIFTKSGSPRYSLRSI